MRISARCDYACRAILELVKHWPKKEPLHTDIISDKQNIPIRYLVHILIELKKMGIVSSIRGKDGGYVLAKKPAEITLGEIVKEVSGPFVPIADTASNSTSAFSNVWSDVEQAIANVLNKVTFEDIEKNVKAYSSILNYQI